MRVGPNDTPRRGNVNRRQRACAAYGQLVQQRWVSDNSPNLSQASISGYDDVVSWEMTIWKVDSGGRWSLGRMPVGDEKAEDISKLLTDKGYELAQELGQGMSLFVRSDEKGMDEAPYALLIEVGPRTEVVAADGLPALTHLMATVKTLVETGVVPPAAP